MPMKTNLILIATLLLMAGSAISADSLSSKGIMLPPVTHRVGAFGSGCDFSSLQIAIDSVNDRDTLLVSNDAIFPLDAVIDKTLTIRGGYSSCTAEDPGEVATRIQGVGSSTPVSIIRPPSAISLRVTLENLEITQGNASFGGGIYAEGDLQLNLRDVTIADNAASFSGGGIMLFDTVLATLYGDVMISSNTAVRGGGLHCEEASVVIEGSLVVQSNSSQIGGAVSLDSCDITAEPASTVSLLLNDSNTTSALRLESESAVTVDGVLAVELNHSESGGAISLVESSTLRARGPSTIIQGNSSELFGVAAINASSSSHFELLSNNPICSLNVASPTLRDMCVAIANHSTSQAPAAILLSDGATANIDRAAIIGNQGNGDFAQFAAVNSSSTLSLSNSVIAGHSFGTGPVLTTNNGTLEIVSTTFANNLGAGDLILATGAFVELHAIAEFDNVGALLTTEAGASAAGTCLFVESGTSSGGLGTAGTLTQSDWAQPDFSFLDFRPSATSQLLDACSDDAFALPSVDIVGQPRPIDLPSITNGAGAYDAGAFELALIALFTDGFEGITP